MSYSHFFCYVKGNIIWLRVGEIEVSYDALNGSQSCDNVVIDCE